MTNSGMRLMGAGVALALAGSLLATAPAASAQGADGLTLSPTTSGDLTITANDYVWCTDGLTRTSKVPAPSGECNFPTKAGPLSLRSGQSVVATVSTASQGTVSFSITGQCAVGSSAYDPSGAATTTAQVANGGSVYVTVLAQNANCVLTGSTPGGGSFAPANYAFAITSPINYDAITLNVKSIGEKTYRIGVVYWCDDADEATAPTNACNFPTGGNRLQLPYQESIKATVFTSSSNPATFSVTGNCAVGSSAFDPSSAATTTAQVAAGGNVYVTALQGSGQCVMTGSTVGGGALVPGSYTYTIDLVRANQQPSSALPNRKRMRVGQRLNLQGPDGIETNAGQTVSWRVLRRSRDNCRIVERSNGSAVLRATSRGQCRVRASAPGVPNEWNRFTQRLNIRVR